MTPTSNPTAPAPHAASPIPPSDTQLLDFLNASKRSLHHISVTTAGGTAKAEGWYVDGAPNLSKTAREAIAAVYPGGSAS